jgi:hypothetical protein
MVEYCEELLGGNFNDNCDCNDNCFFDRIRADNGG